MAPTNNRKDVFDRNKSKSRCGFALKLSAVLVIITSMSMMEIIITLSDHTAGKFTVTFFIIPPSSSSSSSINETSSYSYPSKAEVYTVDLGPVFQCQLLIPLLTWCMWLAAPQTRPMCLREIMKVV